MDWHYLLTVAAAVVIYGLYGTYIGRRNAERGFFTRSQREAQARPVSTRWLVSFVTVVFVALGGILGGRHLWDHWHPAVDEHRDELLDAVANQTSCPKGEMTVVAVSPSVARVDGCGRSLTLRWVSEHRGWNRARWRQIDPNCFRTVLGFITFSCS
jgi:hypothetical protein